MERLSTHMRADALMEVLQSMSVTASAKWMCKTPSLLTRTAYFSNLAHSEEVGVLLSDYRPS